MSTVASATQGGFLSPELVDKIIDEVHLFPLSDEEFEVDMDKWGNTIYKRLSTLTSCSLVYRTWLPRSRYHIFGTTTVSFHSHASFMNLLHSPRNTFLAFVHTLRLDENLCPGDSDHFLGPGYFWLHLFLPTGFLSSFSNLKTLHISHAQFDFTDDDILAEDILGTNCDFPSIRNLNLNGCHFRTLDDVVQTLSSCTALVSASLLLIDVVDPAGMLPIEFALLSPLPQSLSSLTFPARSCPSPMQIISMASASLKHLSIGPSCVDEDSNGIIVLDLVDLQRLTDNIKYCSNLQSIAFCPVNINSFNAGGRREEVIYSDHPPKNHLFLHH
ncbi:hypothetical protein ARMGADRAFT_1172124 [Armillaria gallica]|uniref:F-box domain-containing protein n=1 Tax=Armillaria gallica TaxID=47427 RepID=A0A2H3CA85_ARMGA|nr:hypothetical protein ARMGADRAFT_1172124 [Armillaria gallica]